MNAVAQNINAKNVTTISVRHDKNAVGRQRTLTAKYNPAPSDAKNPVKVSPFINFFKVILKTPPSFQLCSFPRCESIRPSAIISASFLHDNR